MINFDAARVWDRLPRDLRQRLAHLVDDPLRAERLLALLHNMAATINAIEQDAGRELDDDDNDDEDRDE